MKPARRWLARLAVAAVIAAGFSIGVAVSASAHDVLISSNPADGATLEAVPSTVSFTFDQPVQNFDPVVSLIGPDGKQYATGTPQINGSVVTGNVGTGPAGAYIAAYRIVSADGHPVTGEVHFTLAAGAAPASGGAAAGGTASGGVSGTGASGGGASGGGASGTASGTGASGAGASGAGASGAGASGNAAGTGAAASSGAVAAPPPVATTSTSIAAPATKSGGLSAGIWIALVVAALVIAAAAVILLRRPTRQRGAADRDY